MRSSVHRRVGEATKQAQLAFADPAAAVRLLPRDSGDLRAIEDDSFPFEALSEVAEVESWRKEVNRPLSHIHKWWAQRLGTVFRAATIGAFAPRGADVLDLFYSRVRVPQRTVFDPFMGSGTTVTEALKLGARAIGRDINPVAWFAVRNALAAHKPQDVLETFSRIERDMANLLRRYYQTQLEGGGEADVLYYFWVKMISCPECQARVDLFNSYIFASHAYPKKHPESQSLCPQCGEINPTRYDSSAVTCRACQNAFNPSVAPARGTKARCPGGHEFQIAKAVRESGTVPAHRLYAKMVLLPDGSKTYARATEWDQQLYASAERELNDRGNAFPVVRIEPGYNTNQVLKYNYTHWHQMFNARQLLAFSILGERIANIEDAPLRELFACLLSGTLEFNNMFASYKGEGTGAVRHMFSHHILKPERVPLEANLWGTPKSSGSFSTLFRSRLLRALDYAADPFELRTPVTGGDAKSQKVFGLSERIGHKSAESFAEFAGGEALYLSCGDSSATDIASGTVDAVITDPPFFDNVHYSQLADFFYVWQRHFLGTDGARAETSTRSEAEVQSSDCGSFTQRLTNVFRECSRVLVQDGLLIFSYHHSRAEGWEAVLASVMDAGFRITAAHPVKAEMSVATPKHQAQAPIDLDILLVCRKRGAATPDSDNSLWPKALQRSGNQIHRLRIAKRALSRNDVRVILMAQLIRELSAKKSTQSAVAELQSITGKIERQIDIAHLAGVERT